jgi:hypothetical protein
VTSVSVIFPDPNAPPFGSEEFSTNLITPEPCPLSRKLPSSIALQRYAQRGVEAKHLFVSVTLGVVDCMNCNSGRYPTPSHFLENDGYGAHSNRR